LGKNIIGEMINMIKELVTGLIYLIITTIIVYPVSHQIALAMEAILPSNIINFLLTNLVRYIGFIIGVLTIKWIYNSLQQQNKFTSGEVYNDY